MSFNVEPPEDRRPNLTPTLALRVAIVGSVVLALFAIVFFRLWFLQVLTGHHYVLTASRNQTRSVLIAPPRGEILDAGGHPLVTSKTALNVEIVPTRLPTKVNASNLLRPSRRDRRVYDRLATVLHIAHRPKPCKVPVPPPSCNTTVRRCPHSTTRRLSPIACTVATEIALYPYADVTVKEAVAPNVEYYLDERANRFRGVQVQQSSITGYPFGDLAAQTLGTVGRVTAAELKEKSFRGVNRNAIVGQTGLEAEYDQFLRGTFGKQRVEVNASGIPVGEGRTVQPTAGHNLQTSLDTALQKTGQSSLQESIDQNAGLGGAFVALDPQTGSIYGMGSLPSFDPSVFTKPILQSTYDRLFGSASNDPLFNRAVQSESPTGSTFKVITSTAALQSGEWSVGDTFDDSGEFCPPGVPAGSDQCRHNAGHAAYGTLDLTDALKVSDDVFFYHLGALLNVDKPDGGPLQQWAHRFGVGRKPEVDLPRADVGAGTLPDPAWRAERNKLESECDAATGPYRYSDGKGDTSPTRKRGYTRSPKHAPGGCGIADGTDRPWSEGDNINLAVGQGDVQVSPLQLAIVYSAIENGGTIVRPHLGESIQDADGTVLQKIDPPPARHLDITASNLDAIRTGLHEAAQGGGTSSDVMGSFPLPVYGKTGTAQYIPYQGPRAGEETDYGWYACYVPASATSKPIVVVVWVEGGGFGDVASAPVARQILSQWFLGKPGAYSAGSSADQ
jgi:penicillin-binding protein 2